MQHPGTLRPHGPFPERGRSQGSEAPTAPSYSRDDALGVVAAATRSSSDEGMMDDTAPAAGNSRGKEGGDACVVGINSTSLSVDGPPICQAKAASAEGPLGRGPTLPPPSGRRIKSGYIPYNPYGLSRLTRQLLELTELPFMILWVYFAYFVVIVALTAHKVKSRVWLSALVAGTLVGIGLNANGYRAIMYRGYPDVGVIVRFFLIPFGVSALSGLTHSLREQFLLVFPVDPIELLIAIMVPTVVVCSLLLSRIILLYKRKIPIDLRNFFLNGSIYS